MTSFWRMPRSSSRATRRSSGYNLTLQTTSTGLSLLTGSPAAGMALSFGAASYAQETRG